MVGPIFVIIFCAQHKHRPRRFLRHVAKILCAHAGFEGGSTLGELLRGELVGRTVYIRFWRVPFAQIPSSPDGRADWLYGEWEKVEEFVKEHACSR